MSKARHSRAHKVQKKESGGRIGMDRVESKIDDVYAGKDSDVLKDAERRKRGGAVHHGRKPEMVEGEKPKHHRLDRPGRKRGGRVGADTSPMTSAATLTGGSGRDEDD